MVAENLAIEISCCNIFILFKLMSIKDLIYINEPCPSTFWAQAASYLSFSSATWTEVTSWLRFSVNIMNVSEWEKRWSVLHI